jgi:beta-galactosidase
MFFHQASPRAREWFGFDWHFRLDEESDFRPVQLPHDWSAEYGFDENAPSYGSGGYVKTGTGLYTKRFFISPSAKGKKISLHFDGAYMCASATLNGRDIGGHVYGYTPFELDITDCVDFKGENELIVMIDNSRQPGSRWYSGSGITRDVWIEAVSPVHIKTFGTFIRLHRLKEGSALMLIDTDITGGAGLTTRFFDRDGNLVAEASASAAHGVNRQEILLPSPRLWSHRDPYLYRAESILTIDGKTVDIYHTPFGVRQIAFTPDEGFFINGERVKLRGVCLHHDGGSVGAAVPLKVWRRRLEKLAGMGVNAIRTAHNPPDPGLLDLCDSLGLYVMDEAFDEWGSLKWKTLGSNTHESRGYSEWFEEHHEADLTAMLLRDRNHPSVILWSIGNEVPEQTQPEGHKTALRLISRCRKLDPTRLCTQANDQICAEPKAATDEFLDTLDVVSYNYTGRWRNRAETFCERDKRTHPARIILGAENTSAGGLRGDCSFREVPHSFFKYGLYYTAAAQIQRLLRFVETHDYMAGDFIWTGFDYLGEVHWPYRSALAGILDTCGFEKDHYYFYQSIWRREEPMVHLLPHWNLDVPLGSVVPVLCYTSCEQAELFVNGKSYGRKAYSYPLYGMTEIYGHFDTPPIQANTDDMFLSWDAPYEPGVIEVIGYNGGLEVCRHTIKTAGPPARLSASADTETLAADGRDVVHIEVRVTDAEGLLCPTAHDRIHAEIEGCAELIGIDNGRPDCLDSFKGSSKEAMGGLLLIILRSKREAGEIRVKLRSGTLKGCEILLASS